MNFLINVFLKKYESANFTIKQKAKALMIFYLIVGTLLVTLAVLYSIFIPESMARVWRSISVILLFLIIGLFVLRAGYYYAAVNAYLFPTIVIMSVARFMKIFGEGAHTGFSGYIYYMFYLIIFASIFAKRIITPLVSIFFIVSNVIFFIMVKDLLDPLGYEAAKVGISNSTMVLIIISIISYINTILNKTSNEKHKQDGESNKEQFEIISSIFDSVKNVSKDLVDTIDTLTVTSEKLTTDAQSQAGFLEESSASMEEMTSAVSMVSKNAKTQANSIHEVDETMGEIDQSIKLVSEKTKAVMNESDSAIKQADEAAAASKEALVSFKQMQNNSVKIQDIIKLISEIADKTNLLSLNAAIESARAGEAGRGFAVVADEISKLADTSTASAKEISVLINETTTGIEKNADMFNRLDSLIIQMKKSLESSNVINKEMNVAFEKQIELNENNSDSVRELNTLADTIAIAMDEQSNVSAELSNSMDFVNTLTQNFAENSATMSETIRDVAKNVEILNEMNNLDE